MNLIMMCNYIKICTNRLLIALGCSRYYKIGNLFEWMEMISLQGETDFFEKRIKEYSISGVGVDRVNQTFALNSSFPPPLTSPHPHIHNSSSSIYMLHTTLFPVGTPIVPPHSHTFASKALRKHTQG
jgi:hypothetical protein